MSSCNSSWNFNHFCPFIIVQDISCPFRIIPFGSFLSPNSTSCYTRASVIAFHSFLCHCSPFICRYSQKMGSNSICNISKLHQWFFSICRPLIVALNFIWASRHRWNGRKSNLLKLISNHRRCSFSLYRSLSLSLTCSSAASRLKWPGKCMQIFDEHNWARCFSNRFNRSFSPFFMLCIAFNFCLLTVNGMLSYLGSFKRKKKLSANSCCPIFVR